MAAFVKNERYVSLLLENASFNKKVSAGHSTYDSQEYKDLKQELLKIERKMSAKDIIKHAEDTFPRVEA